MKVYHEHTIGYIFNYSGFNLVVTERTLKKFLENHNIEISDLETGLCGYEIFKFNVCPMCGRVIRWEKFERSRMSLSDIKKATMSFFGITEERLDSESRVGSCCTARSIFAGIAKENYYTPEEIGNFINRSRVSIYHMIENYRNFMKIDKKYKEKRDCIYNSIKKKKKS